MPLRPLIFAGAVLTSSYSVYNGAAVEQSIRLHHQHHQHHRHHTVSNLSPTHSTARSVLLNQGHSIPVDDLQSGNLTSQQQLLLIQEQLTTPWSWTDPMSLPRKVEPVTDQKEIDEWLEAHNYRRKQLQLRELEWDPELSQFAANFLPQLRPTCKGTMHSKGRHPPGPPLNKRYTHIGENLYSSYHRFPHQWNPGKAYDAWYNEIGCFKYGGPKSLDEIDGNLASCDMNGPQVGHFTQVMWERVTHVGCAHFYCGSTKFGDYQTDAYIYSCNYGNAEGGIAGNGAGMSPFGWNAAKKLKIPSVDGKLKSPNGPNKLNFESVFAGKTKNPEVPPKPASENNSAQDAATAYWLSQGVQLRNKSSGKNADITNLNFNKKNTKNKKKGGKGKKNTKSKMLIDVSAKTPKAVVVASHLRSEPEISSSSAAAAAAAAEEEASLLERVRQLLRQKSSTNGDDYTKVMESVDQAEDPMADDDDGDNKNQSKVSNDAGSDNQGTSSDADTDDASEAEEDEEAGDGRETLEAVDEASQVSVKK